jgi:hypothetical protein
MGFAFRWYAKSVSLFPACASTEEAMSSCQRDLPSVLGAESSILFPRQAVVADHLLDSNLAYWYTVGKVRDHDRLRCGSYVFVTHQALGFDLLAIRRAASAV